MSLLNNEIYNLCVFAFYQPIAYRTMLMTGIPWKYRTRTVVYRLCHWENVTLCYIYMIWQHTFEALFAINMKYHNQIEMWHQVLIGTHVVIISWFYFSWITQNLNSQKKYFILIQYQANKEQKEFTNIVSMPLSDDSY